MKLGELINVVNMDSSELFDENGKAYNEDCKSDIYNSTFSAEILSAALDSDNGKRIINALTSYPILDLATGIKSTSVAALLAVLSLHNIALKGYIGIDNLTEEIQIKKQDIHSKLINFLFPNNELHYKKKWWDNLFFFDKEVTSLLSQGIKLDYFSLIKDDVLSATHNLPEGKFNVILGGLETGLFVDWNYAYHLNERINELIAPGGIFVDLRNGYYNYNIKSGEKIQISYLGNCKGNIHFDLREKIILDENIIEIDYLTTNTMYTGSRTYKGISNLFFKSLNRGVFSFFKELEKNKIKILNDLEPYSNRLPGSQEFINNFKSELNDIYAIFLKLKQKDLVLSALENYEYESPTQFKKYLTSFLEINNLENKLSAKSLMLKGYPEYNVTLLSTFDLANKIGLGETFSYSLESNNLLSSLIFITKNQIEKLHEIYTIIDKKNYVCLKRFRNKIKLLEIPDLIEKLNLSDNFLEMIEITEDSLHSLKDVLYEPFEKFEKLNKIYNSFNSTDAGDIFRLLSPSQVLPLYDVLNDLKQLLNSYGSVHNIWTSDCSEQINDFIQIYDFADPNYCPF